MIYKKVLLPSVRTTPLRGTKQSRVLVLRIISLCVTLVFVQSLRAQQFQTLTLPPPPADSIQSLQADPNIFAFPFYVDFDVREQASSWIMNDTLHYALTIVSPGAYSLNVIFSEFFLAPGARVTLYNAAKTQREIISRNSFALPTLFASPIIEGDTLTICIQEPLSVHTQSQFRIGQISYAFKPIGIEPSLRLRATDCHIDINCPEAEAWETQKHAVCKLIISGTRLCSGTLVNTTANSGEPYVLTANHCVNTTAAALGTVFYFNYEYPVCGNTSGLTTAYNISGSELLATGKNNHLDFSLLRMVYAPPMAFNVYYAGWDRNSAQTQGEACIHHPAGGAKRLALSDNTPLRSTSFSVQGTNYLSNSHWLVSRWAQGTTEGGSSGSALFNPDKRIIASLTGGESTCANPQNDYFSKFSFAWDYDSEPQYQLKAWLDPLNTGAVVCDGFFPYGRFPASNILLTDSIALLNFGEKASGSWASSNALAWTAFAEKFSHVSDSLLYAIHLLGEIDETQNLADVEFCVWQGGDVPTHIVWQKTFDASMIISEHHVLIPFSEVVPVSGNYWVGYRVQNNSTAFTAFVAKPRSSENSYFVYSSTHSAWIFAADVGTHTSMAVQLMRTANVLVPPFVEDSPPEFSDRLRENSLSWATRELFETDSISVFSAQTLLFTLTSRDVSTWSGENEMGMNCFANLLRVQSPQLIAGITAGINAVGNATRATTFCLWNGRTNELLYSREVENSFLTAHAANRVYFPQPIAVRDSFYVGVCYDKHRYADTSSLFLIANNTAAVDAAFQIQPQAWQKYRNLRIMYNLALQPITAFSPYLYNPDFAEITYSSLLFPLFVILSENASCTVFPQPASDYCYVRFRTTLFQSIDCALFNVQGAQLWKGSVPNRGGVHAIPLGSVPKGVYILQITVAGSTQQVKIVKA